MHNYFLAKSLLLRPGGLLIALTSRWTLDAANTTARRELAALADLVGAVRLPAGAFHDVAGTEVVCDLLVLRRRDDVHEAERADREWLYALPSDLPRQPLVSGYFSPIRRWSPDG